MKDWRDLARQGKYAEAEKLMLAETEHKTGYGDEVITRAAFYEDWGEHAEDEWEKRRAFEKSLGYFQLFASWATSGGEGSARMIDVLRVERKLAGLNDAD